MIRRTLLFRGDPLQICFTINNDETDKDEEDVNKDEKDAKDDKEKEE